LSHVRYAIAIGFWGFLRQTSPLFSSFPPFLSLVLLTTRLTNAFVGGGSQCDFSRGESTEAELPFPPPCHTCSSKACADFLLQLSGRIAATLRVFFPPGPVLKLVYSQIRILTISRESPSNCQYPLFFFASPFPLPFFFLPYPPAFFPLPAPMLAEDRLIISLYMIRLVSLRVFLRSDRKKFQLVPLTFWEVLFFPLSMIFELQHPL